MFPPGRLLKTHHHCQPGRTVHHSHDQLHHLSRETVLELAQFTSARSPLGLWITFQAWTYLLKKQLSGNIVCFALELLIPSPL